MAKFGALSSVVVRRAGVPDKQGGGASVAVAGAPNTGETLSFSVDPAFKVASVQWYRETGGVEAAISGATGLTYKTVSADAGCSVFPRVTGYLDGAKRTISAKPVAPTIISAPAITRAVEGDPVEFTVAQFSGTPAPSITNSWTVNGVPVGAQTPTIQVPGVDVSLVQTAINAAGTVSTAPVTATVIPKGVAPTVVAAPVITSAWVGQQVQFTAAQFSGNPAPSVTTTWYIDGVASGSTAPTVSAAGKQIAVKQTATNATGSVDAQSPTVTSATFYQPQVISPFTIGTLDVCMASLDEQAYETDSATGTLFGSFAQRQLSNYLPGATLVSDALQGLTMANWYAGSPRSAVLARAGTANLVVVMGSPLGNDITAAINSYGSASAAPDSYWTAVMNYLTTAVAEFKAAGFKVIVGNNTYRNYGLDDSCRSNEDKGAHYVNRRFLEPWIKANMPECWDSDADRPFLDHYNFSWNVGNWLFASGDAVHHSLIGKNAFRNYTLSVVTSLSKGVKPAAIGKRSWPFSGVSATLNPVVVAFGLDTTLTSAAVPANLNRVTVATSATLGAEQWVMPASYKDVTGAATSLSLLGNGFYYQNNTGRGNAGDASLSVTNGVALSGAVVVRSTSGKRTGILEIHGLKPYGNYTLLFNASATLTTTAGDKVTSVVANSSAVYSHVSDEAAPGDYLTIPVTADPLGVVHIGVNYGGVLGGSTNYGYMSAIQIQAAA